MTVSLIVSTYNRPDALKLCLDSVLTQSVLPDQVVVGDDGSGEETKRVVEAFSKLCPVPVVHVWHPDEGFRLAAIRNKSVAASTGEYIVQIDGDIVMHRHFIADHKAAATKGFYVKGSRIRLSPEFTAEVCRKGFFTVPAFLSSAIMKDREKALRLPFGGAWLSRHYKVDSTTGIGCNMAFWRSDFLAVNGYDEFYEGWGAEDTDLCTRFSAIGLHNFKLFRTGLCYHLWHHEADMSSLSQNQSHLAQAKKQSRAVCENGISKYL